MNNDDIPAGLALCRMAGWNQLQRDWKLFLDQSIDGCLVAEDDTGKVIGTVATIRYGDKFSWIGMVLVDNDMKRQGIGTKLLNAALDILQHEATVKLDATPAGREVYLKLNFEDEYLLTRMQINDATFKGSIFVNIRPLMDEDMDAVRDMDAEVFGANRAKVLEWIHEGAPQLAFVYEKDGKISGYCFGRNGYKYTHIGPVIAERKEQAIELITAALHSHMGKPAIIDVKKGSGLQQWLISSGFTEQRELIRMYKGKNLYPGIPEKQFAILGPEFG